MGLCVLSVEYLCSVSGTQGSIPSSANKQRGKLNYVGHHHTGEVTVLFM